MPTDDRWSPAPPDGFVPPDGYLPPGGYGLPEQRGADGPPASRGRVYGSPRPVPGNYPPGPPPQRRPDPGPGHPPGGPPPRIPRQPPPRPVDNRPLTEPRAPVDPRPLIEPRPPIKTGRRKQRKGGRWLIALVALLVLAVIGAGLRFIPGSPLAPTSAENDDASDGGGVGTGPTLLEAPSPTLAPLPFRSTPVSVATQGFVAWALLDRRTGEIVGSENYTEANTTTASMVKAWLAADNLRRAAEAGQTPSSTRLATIETMIRDSNNEAAIQIYNLNGKTASIQRLIRICELTDSRATPGEWSRTYVSARDTVRMGDCIADGRAAGEKWTPWLLDMMRKVRGDGDFGPRKALPAAAAAKVAIKNGWLARDETKPITWHVSCLAIGDTWVIAVLQRYVSTGQYEVDFRHTQDVAREVAVQLLNPDAQ